MYKHLLVPLDGSELGTNLVTQAVDYARSLGARITFFTAREDLGASGDGALLRSLSPETFAEVAAGPASAILAKAIAAAGAFGIVCEGVTRTGARPYELILEVANERGCDLIFMASHGRRGLKAMVVGSQTQKVLAHSTLPVLVTSVESNVRCSAADAAIAIIKDEHRAIAAVINGLRHLAGALRAGDPADLDFLAQMMHYLQAFPEVLHHPKEEQYLFARLARRTDETAELIATLKQQHREGAQAIAAIEALIPLARQDAAQRGALGEAILRFTDAQWQHLSAEEKYILPAAKTHLHDDDWREIDAAFRENSAVLRVGSEQDAAFKALFVRLMNLAGT